MQPVVSSINPPLSAVNKRQSSPQRAAGQRLLSLIRGLSKPRKQRQQYKDSESQSDHEYGSYEDIFDVLTQAVEVVARRGLLQGDVAAGQRLLAANEAGDPNAVDSRGNPGASNDHTSRKRRKRSHQGPQPNLNGAGQTDEQLFLAAVLRILNQGIMSNVDSIICVGLVANWLKASAGYILGAGHALEKHACRQAEYQLMLTSAKPIAKGLLEAGQQLATMHTDTSVPENHHELDREDASIAALESTLRALTVIVGLFGSKLSPYAQLVSDLRELGWSALSIANKRARQGGLAFWCVAHKIAQRIDPTWWFAI